MDYVVVASVAVFFGIMISSYFLKRFKGIESYYYLPMMTLMLVSLWKIGRLLRSDPIRSKVLITEMNEEKGVEDCWMLKMRDLRICFADFVLLSDKP